MNLKRILEFVLSCVNSGIICRIVDKLTWVLLTPEDWALRYAARVSWVEIASSTSLQGKSLAQAALQQALLTESDQVAYARISTALTQLNSI